MAGEALTPDGFDAVVARRSANSPAGEPGKNPDAAVLVFLRASHRLCWVADGRVVSVECQPTAETDDTKQGGPTPVGEYLIGRRYTHDTHQIDWYQLHPRTEDDSGYHAYTATTRTGRFAIALHPGSVSRGCVTVKSAETPCDQSEAWKAVRATLDSSRLVHENDEFSGLLYVEDM